MLERLRACAIAIITVVPACTVDTDGVQGSDHALLANGRLVVPVLDAPERSAEGAREHAGDAAASSPALVRVRGVLDLEATASFATGTLHDTGVTADYSLLEATAGLRGGVQLWEQLRFDGILGVGWQRVALDGLPGAEPRADDSGLGGVLGAQITWSPLPRVELFARATQLGRYVEADSDMLDVGVAYAPLPALRVFVGYRHWHEQSVLGGTVQGVDLLVEGVLVGVEVRL